MPVLNLTIFRKGACQNEVSVTFCNLECDHYSRGGNNFDQTKEICILLGTVVTFFICGGQIQKHAVKFLKPRLHDTTCCQTVHTNIQPVQPAVSCIQPVVKPVSQPGLTTGCIV